MDEQKFKDEVLAKARVVNRDELVEILDNNIKEVEKYRGQPSYSRWKEEAENEKEYSLGEFDKGNPAIWYSITRHFGHGFWGEDIQINLYTDGTHKITYYGCSD